MISCWFPFQSEADRSPVRKAGKSVSVACAGLVAATNAAQAALSSAQQALKAAQAEAKALALALQVA